MMRLSLNHLVSAAIVLWCSVLISTHESTAAQPALDENKNIVVVLGMIHGQHKTSDRYSVEYLQRVIEIIDPDYVITEIPPDRLAAAAAGFAQTGIVTEERVARFPEYVDVLFPMTKTHTFKIIPAAAWTGAMADYRREALDRLSKDPDRASDWKNYTAALKAMDTEIGDRDDDPLFIHTDEYDEITKKGLAPYATLFTDDLGRGDWESINEAHYALIDSALNNHQYEGKLLLITFGAGHKYWFMEQLRLRNDIVLMDPRPFLEAAQDSAQ